MSRSPLLFAALLIASASTAFGEDLSHLAYMVPPEWLQRPLEAAALPEIVTRVPRSVLEPVEAPRPAPPVDVVMTPVGEMFFSCAVPIPSESLLVAPVIAVQSEPVTVVFQPVVAPRPSL